MIGLKSTNQIGIKSKKKVVVNMKNLVMLEITEIPIEYVGLFVLLVVCFIVILAIKSRE